MSQVDALQRLRSPELVASSREKSVEDVASDYPVATASAQASTAVSIVAGTGITTGERP